MKTGNMNRFNKGKEEEIKKDGFKEIKIRWKHWKYLAETWERFEIVILI